jgi:omega-6 fatty acid desaturase (delta-12 desaturase)
MSLATLKTTVHAISYVRTFGVRLDDSCGPPHRFQTVRRMPDPSDISSDGSAQRDPPSLPAKSLRDREFLIVCRLAPPTVGHLESDWHSTSQYATLGKAIAEGRSFHRPTFPNLRPLLRGICARVLRFMLGNQQQNSDMGARRKETKTGPLSMSNGWLTVTSHRGLWQIVSSIVAYLGLLALMYQIAAAGSAAWLILSVPAAGLLVRIFVIQHDCGHYSLLRSKRGNVFAGRCASVLTLTPFRAWARSHALHHAGSGDLDRRNVGDIWTLTVTEYSKAKRFQKLAYAGYRHPAFLFGIAPLLSFVLRQRFPLPGSTRRERWSVLLTNGVLLAFYLPLGIALDATNLALIHLPVISFATSIGVWLFYVQHDFAHAYFAKHEDWDYRRAAVDGSSYYKLPRILRWFTGNIGFHHVHHLDPRIPNYHLERYHRENAVAFAAVPTLTLRSSLRCLKLRLWDERRNEMVTFSAATSRCAPRSTGTKA